MLKKMSQRRRAAFLRALEATGNLTLAAERACVSRSWVLKERRGNAEFDAACRAALRHAQDRLAAHPERRPPTGWGHLDGVELVVRGTPGRRLQIARARAGQISPSVEQRLLQVLSATCNGDAACRAAGVSKSAVWNHRKRWQGFARKWDGTVAEAYLRLESGLLQNATNIFSEGDPPPELPMPPITFEQAIHLLHMHKHQARGLGKAPGRKWRPPPTLAERRPGILRKRAALERSWAVSEEVKAKDEEEWGKRRLGRG